MTDRQVNGLRSLCGWLRNLAARSTLDRRERRLAGEYADIVQQIADENEASATPDPVTLDELFNKEKK